MKTKLKKHGVKILTMIICMVSLVTSLVIVPSADAYDDNCIHYWYYFNHTDRPQYDFTHAGTRIAYYYKSDRNMKLAYIAGKDGNGNNIPAYHLFKEVTVLFDSTYYTEMGVYHEVYNFYLLFDYDFTTSGMVPYPPSNFAQIEYDWDVDGNKTITLYWYPKDGGVPLVIEWLPSYGNYNLQLWLDPSALVNTFVSSPKPIGNINNIIDSMFRRKIISYPKTYTQGYSNGIDFGLEEGYANGYDRGSIDGYQQGYTEGETIGYNDGYEVGYSDGNGDGYSLGYDEGEAYGWANGFGAGQNDMAETSHTFKEMVFAIFDAPSRLIDSMLNFDIFGINLAGLVKTIITLAVVAVILVILVKWLL